MATKRNILLALDFLTQGQEAPVKESLKKEAVALQKASKPWTAGPGIQGLGISYKTTENERLKDLVLKVYVEKKLPKSKCKNLVPSKVTVGSLDGDIDTDVEEIGLVAKESNTGRVRPAIPGFGVGHVDVTVGTFGCLVRKNNNTRTLYMLSNSHVLANEGVAQKGDTIIQPGDYDGGKDPDDKIAVLDDWVPFQFTDLSYPNLVDAAIAKVKKSDVTSAIRIIGVPNGVSNIVRIGTKVQKTGRTTDYTTGVVTDVNYRLALNFLKPGGGSGRVGLQDQVLCTRYTAGGDSGSAVVNMGGNVVGLHFAGSPSTSIFNKIQHVLDLLDIHIVTEQI